MCSTALARVCNGDDFLQQRRNEGSDVQGSETALQLSYRYPWNDGLALQPGLQYIRHPGMDPALNHAWYLSLRFEWSMGGGG